MLSLALKIKLVWKSPEIHRKYHVCDYNRWNETKKQFPFQVILKSAYKY